MTPLANGFAATSDPARLQELCDLVQAGTVRVFFESWMSRIPLPLTSADREHGCWWQLAMRQVEVSRTLVFDDPRRVRTVFEELLARNISLGRLEHVEKAFERAFAEKEYTVAAELASCLGDAGREGRAIQLLEETIAAAEASQAVPAARYRSIHQLRE